MPYSLQIKSQFLFNSLFVLAMCIVSCSKGPDFAKNYGETKTEYRKLSSFNKIRVGERFKVFITADTGKEEGISITYGDRLLSKISTAVNDSFLIIEDKNGFNWVRSFKHTPLCTLNLHSVNTVRIEGAAEVICLDSIAAPKLEVQMNSVGNQVFKVDCGQLAGACSNTGSIEFMGRGTIFAWTCEDGGSMNAKEMFCHDAYLYHYTAHDIQITPINRLEAWAYGTGNIIYYSNPVYTLLKNEFGRGKILKR